MNVTVAVESDRVPAWQKWCIDGLREVEGARVSVVRAPGAPPSRRAAPAKLTGPALAPTAVTLSSDAAPQADIVLDLAGGAAQFAAPGGVWSLRLGETADGALPFAREIGAGRTFEIALERRLDGKRDVLRSGRFGFTGYYASTLRLVLELAARWPAIYVSAANRARLPAPERDAAPAVRAGALDTPRFALALARGAWKLLGGSLFEGTEWNVGLVHGDARDVLASEPLHVRWLPAPARDTFIADPFIVERDGLRVLFVEAYESALGKGKIDALTLADDGSVASRERILDLDTHLSYPYPLEIDGELYLIPENSDAREAALYRCVEFPHRWTREAALFENLDATDTTIVPHDGRWWAFCSQYAHGEFALFAYHAASPRGPWTPHALNPIVCDITRARPAGTPFVVDGALFRPGQDCSRSYGGGLTISRIDVLTPDDYRETVVRRIQARTFARYRDGVHTLSFGSGVIVIDGKRTFWDVRRLRYGLPKAARLLSRLVRRRAAST